MDAAGIAWAAESAVALCAMALTARSDVRTRRVPDRFWVAMLALGVPLASLSLIGLGARAAACHLAGASLMAAYVLSPRVSGLAAVPVLVGSVAASVASGAIFVALMPLLALLFPLLYRLRVIAGGADVKCLMAVSLLYPLPTIGALPTVLPVAVLALALSLLWALPVLARNIRAGRVGRGMLTTYVAEVESIDTVFEWPVRRIRGGELVPCRGSPDTADEIVGELRAAGITQVEVTPPVPFIAPAAMALALVLLLSLVSRCRAPCRTWRSGSRRGR